MWANQRGADGGDGSIVRAPLDGGKAEVLSAGESSPGHVIADAERYYFLTMGELRTLPRE